MRPPKPNSVEPPWYGTRIPVVWEGWRREASPYPDLAGTYSLTDARHAGPIVELAHGSPSGSFAV